MRKFIVTLTAAAVALGLAACGSTGTADATTAAETEAKAETEAETEAKESEAETEAAEESEASSDLEGTALKVAVSPTPHGEILKVAADLLAEQGVTVDIIEFTDYVQPNMVTENEEVDANYFQHEPYLDAFNEENGTHLVSVGSIHYEPFGLYPGKSSSLDDIADGAVIAVPNDTTNEARALQLLAAQGIIKLKEDVGLTATVNDITENPHNVEIEELEAAQLPRTLADVDYAVMNGNYALEAGFSVAKDSIATEDASSEAAQTYANILCVKEGRENDPAILALYDALRSDEVKAFIEETYNGAVVAIC